jgi:hypothetical protein
MAQRVPPIPAFIAASLYTAALLLALVVGCSKKPTGIVENSAPQTELSYAPAESDTAFFRVHLYWTGYDNDGEVVLFRFAIDADTTRPPSQWTATTAHDSVFIFAVDPVAHVQGHVFWIVAQDNDGHFDPTPAKRFFSSQTLPPTSRIVLGPLLGTTTGPSVRFSWEGTDPDGSPTGTESPAASFEYILLQPEKSASEGQPPLPPFSVSTYDDLINGSSGTSLAPPYDDWTWVRTTETAHRFTGLMPGYCVVAERAVDEAGARETNLVANRNIRWFVASSIPPGPVLTITSDVLLDLLRSGDPTIAPDFPARPIEIMNSQKVSFSWTAAPSTSGAPVLGYSFALDDTTTNDWSEIDARKTAMTLPAALSEGPHFLFVRAVDDDGGVSLAVVRLSAVRPKFQDGPPLALWVDDFTAPGGSPLTGRPNYPSDDVDDEWWRRVLLGPLSSEFGFVFDEWDTYRRSDGLEGRGKPSLSELANYRVVIWSVDLNNTSSSPTALWRTSVGEISSELANYVRGGGTLILTGFVLANNASNPPGTPYSSFSRGMCTSLQPGSGDYRRAYFTRTFMGIDAARSSDEATRTNGARDFVEARVTSGGSGLGFQSAEVDTGGTGSGAKWNPYAFPGGTPDITLAPGLPKIEGWKMQSSFACGQQGMRVENPGAPIALPLFTYHGVNQGVLQNGAPSKREDLIVGVATQAHDLGESDGRAVTPGDTRGVMGRTVYLGFPIYYMKDDQAYPVMKAAFAYVNASPTLGAGGF